VLDLNKGVLVDPVNGNIVDNLIESVFQLGGENATGELDPNVNIGLNGGAQKVFDIKTLGGIVEVKPFSVNQVNLMNDANALIKRTVDPVIIAENNEIKREQMNILNGNTLNQQNLAFTKSPI